MNIFNLLFSIPYIYSRVTIFSYPTAVSDTETFSDLLKSIFRNNHFSHVKDGWINKQKYFVNQ